MKKAMIDYMKNGINDEIYTPPYAVEPILEFIPTDKVVWCPFDKEESQYVKLLKERGNKVIYSHKDEFKNFFEYEPEEHYDIIISNPPFSLKDDIIERCYKLNKPFALLLPITTLEGKRRGKMFRQYGLEVLVLDSRVEFLAYMNENGKKNNWFNTSYFCWKLLPQPLIFKELHKS